ncbi:hypothetical protein KGF54_000506 [Candida jiufengensis]|uniref:uncharacterized protein n=1 Tax=Candida jiufengensis TaxID=497108 RepID=UPI0022246FE0|nr:uncharacterized protein KGF54_000506 [Candida jiufengensis]KAI5956888.1 hypothetical protein KGF54_000506 [Candida jiufengensis]
MSYYNNEDALDGTILKLPLSFIDKETSKEFLSSKIWLYVSKADTNFDEENTEISKTGDLNFTYISLIAIWPEGYYDTVITSSNIYKIFGSNAYDLFPREETFDVFTNLFPLDFENLVESREKDGIHKQFTVSARFELSQYKYEFEPDVELKGKPLQIVIKQDTTWAPKIGQFEMEPVDFDGKEEYKYVSDMFNWIDLYNKQNESLLNSYMKSKKKVDELEEENFILKDTVNKQKKDYNLIIEDLENKFYQVLDAKKSKIFDLLEQDLPKKELIGLNSTYMEKNGKLKNIDFNNIPNIEFSNRKRSKNENGTTKKRKLGTGKRKIKKEEEETSEDESEDQFAGFGGSVKVKKESQPLYKSKLPNSPELKDDSFSSNRIKRDPDSMSKPFNPKEYEPFTNESPEIKDSSFSQSQSFKKSFEARSDKDVIKQALSEEDEDEKDGNNHSDDDDATQYSTSGDEMELNLDLSNNEENEPKSIHEPTKDQQDTQEDVVADSQSESNNKDDKNSTTQSFKDQNDINQSQNNNSQKNNKSQNAVSQADVETDYSDSDDD